MVKKAKEPVFLAWSGGKDSAMALFELSRSKDFTVVGLMSCVSSLDQSVALRGIDANFLKAQAQALQLPIHFVEVSPEANCRVHVATLAQAALSLGQNQGEAAAPPIIKVAQAEIDNVRTVAFGDVYLDDIRDCREECLEAVGMKAIFPLWHRDTQEVSHTFFQKKFRAVVTCIDSESMSKDFLGRIYDQQFVNDLPLTIDPCGENGEFHTVVTEGPNFTKSVKIRSGRQFEKAPFYFQELLTGRQPPRKKAKPVVSRSSQ